MSYILDALRRADAERQRGAVPGLNAQAPAPPQGDHAAPGRGVPFAWVLAGSLTLLALAAAAWLIGRGAAPAAGPIAAPIAATSVAPAPAPAVAPPAPAPASAPPPVVAAAPSAPVPVAALQSAGQTTVTVTVTGPAAMVQASPAGRAAGPRAAAAAAAGQAASTASAAPAASASGVSPQASEPLPAGSRVPALAELPAALRQQLPSLVLGGGTYSEQVAQRLVIVNGQVAHEGDQPAAGIRVVQIRPRSVVLSFRGQLFEMAL